LRTVAQISFFIILSFVLHLLLLPFEFMPPAVSYNPGQVGINYVAKSLDSFYPGAAIPQQKSKVVISSLQKASRVNKNISRHTEPDVLPVVDEIKIASTRPAIKHEPKPPVPTVTGPVAPLPEKVIAKVVPGKTAPVHIVALKEPLPVEQGFVSEAVNPPQDLITQPLQQTPIVIESQVGDDFSSSEGITTQSALVTDNQKPGFSLNDNKDDDPYGQGVRDALPRYDINPPPLYPQVAKLRGWEGKVVFEALILKSGRVGRLKIKASSGYRSLDAAARKAVSRWKFSPAMNLGMPKDSEVEIPITFSLKDL